MQRIKYSLRPQIRIFHYRRWNQDKGSGILAKKKKKKPRLKSKATVAIKVKPLKGATLNSINFNNLLKNSLNESLEGTPGGIGHIGKNIVFETSDQRILNFSKMQRTVKGRWASHSRVGKKPQKQFLGPDADQLTFSITLNAEHGVRPRETVENIEKAIQTGEPQTVVIGQKKVGNNKYVITEMSESWETILNRGEVVKISCDLTLEEYL